MKACVICGGSPTVGRSLCRPCYGRDWALRHAEQIRARRPNPKPLVVLPCIACGVELGRKPGRVGKQLCVSCGQKKWAKENADHLRALARARRKADPEKARAKDHRDRTARPDLAKARQLAYRQRHPERQAEIQRRWYERNRERKIASALQWQKDHPGRHAGNERARRARIGGQFVEYVHPLAVLEMSDGICGICGQDVDPAMFQVDHIIPLFAGGEHSYANTQAAHPTCNFRKGHKETA